MVNTIYTGAINTMTYEDFDPETHKATFDTLQLFQTETVETADGPATFLVPVSITFEEAQSTPWYYVVAKK